MTKLGSEYLRLIEQARVVRINAYAPYSKFAVGAAVLAQSGRVYTGVNCENVSFGGTICAERAALTAAITAGERKFVAIAIASSPSVTPCGICRQMLSEFGDMDVLTGDGGDGDVKVTCLSALLPDAFLDFSKGCG